MAECGEQIATRPTRTSGDPRTPHTTAPPSGAQRQLQSLRTAQRPLTVTTCKYNNAPQGTPPNLPYFPPLGTPSGDGALLASSAGTARMGYGEWGPPWTPGEPQTPPPPRAQRTPVVHSPHCNPSTQRSAPYWQTATTAVPIRSAAPPGGRQPQLQSLYATQRPLMADSHNCSPYTERSAPWWQTATTAISLRNAAPPNGRQPQLQSLYGAQRPLTAVT